MNKITAHTPLTLAEDGEHIYINGTWYDSAEVARAVTAYDGLLSSLGAVLSALDHLSSVHPETYQEKVDHARRFAVQTIANAEAQS